MGAALFGKVPTELDFPKEEREILRFWKEAGIFEKTLAKPGQNGRFVFYEGPPTANGLPHNGHVLTRVIKDLFPRYRTMRGWNVPRKAGWDTHGLPVEVEVEKELRLHGKAAIEGFGVEPFVKRCVESVFRYTKEWEALTERVAFWVDLGDAYVTYHRSYVESVWWALSQLFHKGLLYQGHKVVWWWPQGGTALSSGEVGQGYRSVEDPSVYVALPLAGEENLSLLVWTTTPWTLPSNMYAAVHPALEYAIVRAASGRRFVVAKALLEPLAKKLGALELEATLAGRELEGWRYTPPFDAYEEWNRDVPPGGGGQPMPLMWRVVLGSFVTLDAGTGIVHVAPAFGEDDHEVYRRELARFDGASGGTTPRLLCAVNPDGTFVGEVELPSGKRKGAFERYAGRFVKACDKDIQHDLKDRGLLVFAETYRHDYPFCWRADSDPLIQYARPAWYIRTTALIEQAIANNQAVRWYPEHIKNGRFGDFLANNVDWALSRERWWGTPLNVWVCDRDHQHREAPESVAEITKRNPRAFDHFEAARRADRSLSEHLIVHKPWIDQVTFACAVCGGLMRRVPEVIDCWFDSGCMPFAQWGYPHAPQSKERFEASFPADFISEAIDQTRGWFYSLLMISTLVFDAAAYPHPFKTCMVLGHVSDKEGRKESKSKGNYTPPEIILDRVAMEFAVVDDRAAVKGVALVGRDDLEGLDLKEGSRVRAYRHDAPAAALDLAIRAAPRLPRRQVALHADDRAVLGVLPTTSNDVGPAQVPRLAPEERVTIEDPATPAPGADAFRWFFCASSPPSSATRHSLSNVRALQKEFAVKLRHVHSFFAIYAVIDGFDPWREPALDVSQRPELDRWILSELALTVRDVGALLEDYDVFAAAQKLTGFVDALSNWWVRRSRARFWRSGWDVDKRSAYETLYGSLVTLSQLTAPFTPYGAEFMWQNLVAGPQARSHPGPHAGPHAGRRVAAEEKPVESVHLSDWPAPDLSAVDEPLSRKMRVVRDLVSVGLRARMDSKIKVRQPLRRAIIVLNDERDAELVLAASEMIRDELNVLKVEWAAADARREMGRTRYKPNFRSLGRRGLGKLAQELKRDWAFSEQPGAAHSPKVGYEVQIIERALKYGSARRGDVEIQRDDIEVVFEPKPGIAAAADRVGSVFLDTMLDDELRGLGLLRELVSRIQAARKEMGLEYTDRIRVSVLGGDKVRRVVEAHTDALKAEILAIEVSTTQLAAASDVREMDVEGEALRLGISRA
jgi:isoleucyl-tRNA synthetase